MPADTVLAAIRHMLNLDKSGMALIRQNLQTDHGFVSAKLLAYLLLNAMKSGSGVAPLKQEKLELILSAVALHNRKEDKAITGAIEFDVNPFAYILFISDNLQEWLRPPPEGTIYPEFILDKVIIFDAEIQLHFILRKEDWTDKLVEDEKNYLLKVREMVQSPTGSKSGKNLMLKAFFDSTRKDLRDIEIQIDLSKSNP